MAPEEPFMSDKKGRKAVAPSTGELEDLLAETRRFDPPKTFRDAACIADPSVYESADKDPPAFWESFARELVWQKPWDAVLQGGGPDARWFVGGKINASVNCLDRHLLGPRRNKAALIWEGEPGDRRTWTYFDLWREVNKFGNVLRGLGVMKGDRVAIYMPLIPEAVVAMLACARIGAI